MFDISSYTFDPSVLKSNAAPAALALTLGLVLYTIYGAIWRLYFSPIAHIPGPKFAALTFWNEFYYDVVLGGRYTWKLLEYHEKYGPIIRINPYEVHINDPDFYEQVYVGPTKGRSDKWFWSMRMFGQKDISVFDTLEHSKHRMRREPWNPYFSKASVARVQPVLIQGCVDKFCAKLGEFQAIGKPIIMTYAFACLTTDIISTYSFPQGYGLLDHPGFDSDHYEAWTALSKMGHVLKQFGWLFPVLNSFPMWVTKKTSPETYLILQNQERLLQQARTIAKSRGSLEFKQSSARPSMMQAFMESERLPEAEKRPERIKAEAQATIAAGSITTSRALKAGTYHILANPDVLEKLMAELEKHYPDLNAPPNLKQLDEMPYLTAVMNEIFRISYGSSHRLQRIFPDRPLQYKDVTVPPGTPMSMTALHIHDNETIFPNHRKFDPERWIGENAPFKYNLAFGRGSRSCVGIELAKAEILTTLAGMFRRYGRKMKLYDVVRERDIDPVFDVFNPLPSNESHDLRVTIEKDAVKA